MLTERRGNLTVLVPAGTPRGGWEDDARRAWFVDFGERGGIASTSGVGAVLVFSPYSRQMRQIRGRTRRVGVAADMSDRVSTLAPPRELSPEASDVSQPVTRRRIRFETIPAWIWLAMILAVAAFLRLHALDRVGFNSDEAVYAGEAASIAGSRAFLKYFPIYRAHPVLFPAVVSIPYHFVLSDFVARFVAVLFGLGTIVVCYHLGSLLYGRRAGLVAAGLLALMPYHVIVSRQALLDGPEVFFATLALYSLAKYKTSEDGRWLVTLGGMLGLAFLTKETVIVMFGAVVVYFALDADVRLKRRAVAASVAVFLALALVYPMATQIGGASKSGKSFILWQLLRKPNHGYGFYLTTAVPALGLLLVAIAAVALVRAPTGAFLAGGDAPGLDRRAVLVLQPVADKGIPVRPDRRGAGRGSRRARSRAPPGSGSLRVGSGPNPRAGVTVVICSVLAISLLVPTWSSINSSSSSLAGTGGIPAGRATGRWIREHIPPDVQMLAIGPSMANVLEFYGDRKVWGLSVSKDPRQRNPVYQPVPNPDLAIREGTIQYIVWDTFSADRSSSSSNRLLRYVHKYGGRLIYEATMPGSREPVIRIYEEQP